MGSLKDQMTTMQEGGAEFNTPPVQNMEVQDQGVYEAVGSETVVAPETTGEQTTTTTSEAPVVEDVNISFSQLKEMFGDHADLEAIKQTWQDRTTKAQQYETIATKYEEYESVLPKIKEPFVTPQVKAINNFITNTGIKDLNIASQFIGKSSDDLAKTPIDLLALKEVMDNPDLLTVTNLNDIKEGIASRYGVTSDVEVEDLPPAMRLEVSKASLAVQGKIGAEDSDDYFTRAAKQQSTFQEQQTARFNAVSPKIAELSAGLREVSYEVEGSKAVVQVSDDVRQTIQNELTNYVMFNNVELTEDNVKMLRESAMIRAKQLNVDSLISEAVKASKGVATKQVLTEVHNGQPVVKQAQTVVQTTDPRDWYLKRKG